MGERSHHPDDESTDTWYWMVRGFVTVAVAVAALGALAMWMWLRPLREGPAQSFGLWLACMLLVGCAVLVWSPERRRRAPDSHRVREWLVVGTLVAVSGVMALIGVLVTREDRRPARATSSAVAVDGQPVTFEQETPWAYQPRFVGGLGTSDWSVCRTFVVTGPTGPVAEHVTVALQSEGVELGPHQTRRRPPPVTARCGSRATPATGWWCVSTRSTRPTGHGGAPGSDEGRGGTVTTRSAGGSTPQAEVR